MSLEPEATPSSPERPTVSVETTHSILTIEIPVHHPADVPARHLAEAMLDRVVNSDGWILYQGDSPEDLEDPTLYVEEVPFSAAIRTATLTPVENQS